MCFQIDVRFQMVQFKRLVTIASAAIALASGSTAWAQKSLFGGLNGQWDRASITAQVNAISHKNLSPTFRKQIIDDLVALSGIRLKETRPLYRYYFGNRKDGQVYVDLFFALARVLRFEVLDKNPGAAAARREDDGEGNTMTIYFDPRYLNFLAGPLARMSTLLHETYHLWDKSRKDEDKHSICPGRSSLDDHFIFNGDNPFRLIPLAFVRESQRLVQDAGRQACDAHMGAHWFETVLTTTWIESCENCQALGSVADLRFFALGRIAHIDNFAVRDELRWGLLPHDRWGMINLANMRFASRQAEAEALWSPPATVLFRGEAVPNINAKEQVEALKTACLRYFAWIGDAGRESCLRHRLDLAAVDPETGLTVPQQLIRAALNNEYNNELADDTQEKQRQFNNHPQVLSQLFSGGVDPNLTTKNPGGEVLNLLDFLSREAAGKTHLMVTKEVYRRLIQAGADLKKTRTDSRATLRELARE